MKNPTIIHCLPILLLATPLFAAADPKKDVLIRHRVANDGPRLHHKLEQDEAPEREKVAYLGVETMPVDPTVAAQLGLPRGTGVVVRRVAEGSPASGLLQRHDVLTKLDDQILVNMPQLTVLVRNRKAGDEVKLTLMRAGKETTVRAKLGEHEVPRLADVGRPFLRLMDEDGVAGGSITFGRAMLGFAGPEAGDVMRAIGEDRMNWFAQPRVHILKRRGGEGPTILDLPSGNLVFSDDQGSIEVDSPAGKRRLTLKNKEGEITFQGPIDTPEENDKLPAEVKARLEAVHGVELNDDAGKIKVETKVINPAVRTRHALPVPPPEAGMRSL
ncbi:MAG TPA: PDZ domain-containing protein [Lacunisphaera sp.]|nr:PDZ domain-containing protein [Lacunisphaera sp.]